MRDLLRTLLLDGLRGLRIGEDAASAAGEEGAGEELAGGSVGEEYVGSMAYVYGWEWRLGVVSNEDGSGIEDEKSEPRRERDTRGV